ncbi:MAG: hypothetical protein AB7U82_01095 [Blastocatellales bacterium]
MRTHGMVQTRFWQTWYNMKSRCERPVAGSYKYYGARGIKVCGRWQKFENFRDDMHASYLEHAKKHGEKNTSIERKNSNGDYTPKNCEWATRIEQARNKTINHLITFKGQTKTLAGWAERYNIRQGTLERRINCSKWPIEKAITTPVVRHANGSTYH